VKIKKLLLPTLIILIVSFTAVQANVAKPVKSSSDLNSMNSSLIIIKVGTDETVDQTTALMKNEFSKFNLEVKSQEALNFDNLLNLLKQFESSQIAIIGHGTYEGLVFSNDIKDTTNVVPWNKIASSINLYHKDSLTYVASCYSYYINDYLNNQENVIAPFLSVLDFRVATNLMVSAYLVNNNMQSQAADELVKLQDMKGLIMHPNIILGESCMSVSYTNHYANLYTAAFWEFALDFILSAAVEAAILGSLEGELVELLHVIGSFHTLLESFHDFTEATNTLQSLGISSVVSIDFHAVCVEKTSHPVYTTILGKRIYIGSNIYYSLSAKMYVSDYDGYPCHQDLKNRGTIKTLLSTYVPYDLAFDWTPLSDSGCSTGGGGGGGGPGPRPL
jgi:hypothetical protein